MYNMSNVGVDKNISSAKYENDVSNVSNDINVNAVEISTNNLNRLDSQLQLKEIVVLTTGFGMSAGVDSNGELLMWGKKEYVVISV